MRLSLTWHGHSNFQIAAGDLNILIDPFFTGNPKADCEWKDIPRPDVVLVTHDHGDHVGDAVAICQATGALCGCIVGTAARLVEQGLPAAQIPGGIGFNIGGSITVKGAQIIMTQAFHTSDSGAPAGFIIRLPDGFTLYHAGDSGIFQSMELLGRMYPLDLALLPVGGFFTMDATQAAEATRLLRPRAVIPMHWGTFPLLTPGPEDFGEQVRSLGLPSKVLVLKPGETREF